MHAEMIYIGVAFISSLLLLYKLGKPVLKEFVIAQQHNIMAEKKALDDELHEIEFVFHRVEHEAAQIKQRMLNMQTHLPLLLEEHKNICMTKNEQLMQKYKEDCELKFVTNFTHSFQIDLKQEIIKHIMENVKDQLKKEESLDFPLEQITKKYSHFVQ